MAKKLPTSVFIQWANERDPYLSVSTTKEEACDVDENDGFGPIGAYVLERHMTVNKVVTMKPGKKPR